MHAIAAEYPQSYSVTSVPYHMRPMWPVRRILDGLYIDHFHNWCIHVRDRSGTASHLTENEAQS